MTTIRAAGRVLTVGELREVLAGLPDGDTVSAHGLPVMLAEALSGEVRLDDDDSASDRGDALSDLLEFVRILSRDRRAKIGQTREAAAELFDEWKHLA